MRDLDARKENIADEPDIFCNMAYIGTRHGTGSVIQGRHRTHSGYRSAHDLGREQKPVTAYQHHRTSHTGCPSGGYFFCPKRRAL